MPSEAAASAAAPSREAPDSEAEVAALVREAASARTPLLIEGAGTRQAMLRPVQAARTLSTRALTGVTLHRPTELACAARAGTRVADLAAILDGDRQMLVSEPPDLGWLLGGQEGAGTLGGLVATNLSGPRRIAWGATRDHVLGVRLINGEGEVIRSGGRVLKNVTGLDLCKLLAGSHGTLGVLTEVTLKVLPSPPASGSLLLRGLEPAQGVGVLSQALGSPYGVSAAAHLPAGAAERVAGLGPGSATLIRIEEFAESVTYRLGRLAAALPGAERLDETESRAAWAAIRDARPLAAAPGEAVWRCSVRPSAGPDVLAALDAAGGRGFLDWGGGLVWAAGPAEAHAALTGAVQQAGGVWMLMRGPGPLRRTVAVVPPEPTPLARIAARVKRAMDPHGLFNPGRLRAGE